MEVDTVLRDGIEVGVFVSEDEDDGFYWSCFECKEAGPLDTADEVVLTSHDWAVHLADEHVDECSCGRWV